MKQKKYSIVQGGEDDDFGKVIYQVISDRGMEILSSVGRMKGVLLDVVQQPNLKQKIKVFFNAFNDSHLETYREAFDMEITEAESAIKKLEHKFVDDEGISKEWARILCEDCLKAIKYCKGIEIRDNVQQWTLREEKEIASNDYEDYKEDFETEKDESEIHGKYQKNKQEKNGFLCGGCGGKYEALNGGQILKCPYCGTYYEPSKAFKIAQDINEKEDIIETQEDCLRAVDRCFAKYDGGYRPIISQIVDYISSKKDFSIAYKVLKKIDKLDLGTPVKIEMAMYFIEKMEPVIKKEIRPFLNFLVWKSPAWGKGFRNDDYVNYRDIVIKYQRKRRR